MEENESTLDKTIYCMTGMHSSCKGGAWSGNEYISCTCYCHNAKKVKE
jgi:hypothetical protein